MKKLHGKIALVTGGSRGIGAAITQRLSEEGATVIFTFHKSAAKAEALAATLTQAGGAVTAIHADSASADALTNAVRTITERYGPVDILVNNAGIYAGKAFEDHTLDDYDATMAVNVRAVFVASNEVVKRMPTGGRIITIGSNMADHAGQPQATLYVMSKSALQGFTRGLARDLGARKITVNLVQPGPVDTDMNPADSSHADHARSRMALGAYGSSHDIAGLVSFLAGDDAKYITGSMFTIDGGFLA